MILHRFEDIEYASGLDEFDNPTGRGKVEIRHLVYTVVKKTPKGSWIDMGWGYKRFVLDHAKKRFAYPTIEEAGESFKARKMAQIRICSAKVERAKTALRKYETNHGSNHTGFLDSVRSGAVSAYNPRGLDLD